jgi:hypothetical protein
MSIKSIQRDQRPNVCIVGIETDDFLEDILLPGWITANQTSIDAANNGVFEWKKNDVVLIDYDLYTTLFTISDDFSTVVPLIPVSPITQDIVPAGGGQSGATPLNPGINVIPVTGAGTGVLLPPDVLGNNVIVVNRTGVALNIYPASGDQINHDLPNVPSSLAPGFALEFIGTGVTFWNTL